MTAESQRGNVKVAATALASITVGNSLVVSHGNGPQVGLLALQGAAYKPAEVFPLDILDAETEGMIGYLIEQELMNALGGACGCATILTQIEVDPGDPAFDHPTKPIGPVYSETEAGALARERDWCMARDGEDFRRVVSSPRPRRILELDAIRLLVDEGVIVICAGGGGIPTLRQPDGTLVGVEAVIDKDSASALLARELNADALLMLTDVDAVFDHWGQREARAIRRASPQAIKAFFFAPGSMGPKVQAACEFVEQTGGMAGIGRLEDAAAILRGEAGTVIAEGSDPLVRWG